MITKVWMRSVKKRLRKTRTPEQIEKLLDPARLEAILDEAFERLVPKHATTLAIRLRADGPAMLRQRRAQLRDFERRVYATWGQALDLLEMLIVMAAETGELLSKQWPWTASRDEDLVFDVLRRLQARGCRVAAEALTLLKAGFASGAHARWRTLHETTVTALFIAKHGRDAAERFLAHEYVENKRAADQYQEHCCALGYPRFRKRELDSISKARDAAVRHFPDKEFSLSYGWAAPFLAGADARQFSSIEKAVDLDHVRPYYKMASHAVHANPKAITFSLELRSPQALILTGPSNLGLADPGHQTAISLYQLTATLLATRASLDAIVASYAMGFIVDEIGHVFLETHHQLEKNDARRNPRKVRRKGRGKQRPAARA